MMAIPPGQDGTKNAGRVLVVDDDPISIKLLKTMLGRKGYEVVPARGVAEAQEIIRAQGAESFLCLLTDHRMPQKTGLDLISWMRVTDPTLASILFTAEADKDLVMTSLREGAIDFLDKPIMAAQLYESIQKAIDRTRRGRHLNSAEFAVEQVGQAQEQLQQSGLLTGFSRARLCLHALHRAGGDFAQILPVGDFQYVILLGDVSGHDLKAAYLSAYFHGIFRGMLESKAPIGRIFDLFNQILLKEWNAGTSTGGTRVSISVCTVFLDLKANTLKLWNSGCPNPLFCDIDDGHHWISGGSSPLGWFEHNVVEELQPPGNPPGRYLYLWTDGLEDYASRISISIQALNFRLLSATEKDRREILINASDDISLLRLDLSPEECGDCAHQIIIHEHYHGGSHGQIDEFQAYWERSLKFALPECPLDRLYDVLLCSREALLNALVHGCGGDPEKTCDFDASFHPGEKTLRVRVEDPGRGFDTKILLTDDQSSVLDRHAGLLLIKHFPTRLEVERQGACLYMDFKL